MTLESDRSVSPVVAQPARMTNIMRNAKTVFIRFPYFSAATFVVAVQAAFQQASKTWGPWESFPCFFSSDRLYEAYSLIASRKAARARSMSSGDTW